jgi:probable rRNA maturation factor
MIKADVLINNKDWIRHIRFPSTYINKKLKKIDKKLNIFKKNNFKFTVLLSEDREIKKLNKQFRKKNKTTDILSFPCHKKKNIILLLKKKKHKNLFRRHNN